MARRVWIPERGDPPSELLDPNLLAFVRAHARLSARVDHERELHREAVRQPNAIVNGLDNEAPSAQT